jgi:hypothetical protein
MTEKITLLDMAKLTGGATLTYADGERYAVQMGDKIWVKHLGAYHSMIFEKDIIHKLVMMLRGTKLTQDERVCLHYLAYDLGIEDELERELFGDEK